MTGFIALKLRSFNNNGERAANNNKSKLAIQRWKKYMLLKLSAKVFDRIRASVPQSKSYLSQKRGGGVNVAKAVAEWASERRSQAYSRRRKSVRQYKIIVLCHFIWFALQVFVCVCVVSEKARPLKQTIHSCTHTHTRKWPPNEPSTWANLGKLLWLSTYPCLVAELTSNK